MYLEYFKIHHKPFKVLPETDFYCLTGSARYCYDFIRETIQQHQPYILLSGVRGSGKTTLLKYLIASSDTRVHWIYTSLNSFAEDEFFISMGRTLGLDDIDTPAEHLPNAIAVKLNGLANRDLHPVLIVDGMDLSERTMLQELLKWNAQNQTRNIGLTIIFADLPATITLLDEQIQEKSSTQVIKYCSLKPYDFKQMKVIIAHRLKIAEYSGKRLFDRKALELIYDLSGGSPQVVNQICDLGLFITANRKQSVVSRQIIQEASEFLTLGKDGTIKPPLTKKNSINLSSQGEPSSKGLHSNWLWPKWQLGLIVLVFFLGGGWFLLQPNQPPPPLAPPLNVQAPSNSSASKIPITASQPQLETNEPVSTIKPQVENSFAPLHQVTVIDLVEETNSIPILPLEVAKKSENMPGELDPSELAEDIQPYTESEFMSSTQSLIPVKRATPPVSSKIDSINLPRPTPTTPSKEIVAKAPATNKQIVTVQPSPVVQEKKMVASSGPPEPLLEQIALVTPSAKKPQPSSKVSLATPKPATTPAAKPALQKKQQKASKSSSNSIKLITAAEKGNLIEVQKLLADGADVNSVADTDETALMKAAWAGDTDMIRLFLSYKPRLNKQSLEGWTALFYGAVKGNQAVVASLIAAGAKPDIADQDGRTPLMAAAWNGHTKIVALLLEQHVGTNRKNRDGWTPLMFAAMKGNMEVGRLLLLNGANPSIKNFDGDTSAELAKYQGHAKFSALLVPQNQSQ